MRTEEIKHITRRVRKNIKEILELTDKDVIQDYTVSDFKEVVVIVGSSRGGTSLFFDTLRHHPDFSSPDGEHGKYYTLNDMMYPFLDSDSLPEDAPIPEELTKFMLLDVGRTSIGGTDEEHFIDNFISRLPMQFYYMNFDYQDIKEEYLRKSANFTEVVDRAGIMKRYYDLKSVGIEPDTVFNPLTEFYISETPFIFPHRYKRKLEEKDFSESKLLLKTSVDAYRMGWVDKLFPNSKVKYIHLTRNPAASMNGLIDGWLTNRGFFTYKIPDMDIMGYPRKDLWNYDLPPNWKNLLTEDLTTVVWSQWAQAHRHIMDYSGPNKVLKVKFEDFLYNREETIGKVTDYVGVDSNAPLFTEKTKALNKVMTTDEPRKYRWRDRGNMIIENIKNSDEGFVEKLGYEMNEGFQEWY